MSVPIAQIVPGATLIATKRGREVRRCLFECCPHCTEDGDDLHYRETGAALEVFKASRRSLARWAERVETPKAAEYPG